ncbi:hypothetical protein ACQ4PT_000776 [Festuca glaucescens]
MSLPAITDGTTGPPANLTVGPVPAGGATRHVGLVVISFATGSNTKWCIYMRASLGRASYLGHIDVTTATSPNDATWRTSDYTVLNVLHTSIDEDVADMILTSNQTAAQLWTAARDLFTMNKARKAIYLDNDFRQLVQGSLTVHECCRRQKQLADVLSDNDSPITPPPPR